MRLKVGLSKDQKLARFSSIIFLVAFIGLVNVSNGISPLVSGATTVVGCLGAVVLLISDNNKKLVVCDWGIIFHSRWGEVKKVRYEEITLIKLCPNRVCIVVKFYAGNRCVGYCGSMYNNYQSLMKYLSYHMFDKIEW